MTQRRASQDQASTKMNAASARWARRYRNALRRHLGQKRDVGATEAYRLGRSAVSLGLETLDVARHHEKAMSILSAMDPLACPRHVMIARTTRFFAETVVPIEQTHRAARAAELQVSRLARALRHRTAECSTATRRLARGIAQRHVAQAALRRSNKECANLLRESALLQARLRAQAHSTLTRQEDERRTTSRHLHDEVAQGLLGIHVRLLTLKSAINTSKTRMSKELGSTQRLVRESSRQLRQLNKDIRPHANA